MFVKDSKNCSSSIPIFSLEKDCYGPWQRTLYETTSFTGISVHTGKYSSVKVMAAPVNNGIIFETLDGLVIAACCDNLKTSPLCTVIGKGDKQIKTIEHIMAAFAACGIDNARVIISGDELPILDGSAKEYVSAFARVGTREQSMPRKFLFVRRTWSFQDGDRFITFSPVDNPAIAAITVEIDFCRIMPAIGYQKHYQSITPQALRAEIMPSRTFGIESKRMQAVTQGMALGSSCKNTLLYNDTGLLLNSGGLRFSSECARHKMLDLIGDLCVAGWPIVANINATCPGHTFNGMALVELLNSGAVDVVEII